MDIDRVIKTYIKIRDKRTELKQEYTEADDALKEKLDKLSGVLMKELDDKGLDSFKSKTAGTVSKVRKTRFWPADWDAFFEYMEDFGGAQQFMTRSLAQNTFKEFLEQNPDATPPVNSDDKYAVTVRRPNARK